MIPCLLRVSSRSIRRSILADVLEVLVEANPVTRRQSSFELAEVAGDRIEDTPVRLHAREPLDRSAGPAKHPLEHRARVDLHRQRRGGRGPRQRVHVRAGVAGAAAADKAGEILRGHFERLQRRVLADLPGHDLVDGRADPEVLALGLLRDGTAQPA